MNLINNKYLKIFLLLGVAFLISDFSINNLFLAKSPRINPLAGQNMTAKVNNFWSKTSNLVAFRTDFFKFNLVGLDNNINTNTKTDSNINYKKQNTSPPVNKNSVAFQKTNVLPQDIKDTLSAPLHKISSGVYAGEKNDIKVFEVRLGELEYLEYTFNVNGKEIKIKVPKGQEQPSQEVLNLLYK